MSGLDMYVAEGTLPAVDNTLADKLTKVIDTLIPRMESLERAVSGQASKPTGATRADSFNTLLVRIEEIAANMTRLEKKVEALSSPQSSNMMAQTAAKPCILPPRPAPLYSEKAAGTSNPGVAKSLPPVPPSSYINRFKLGQVVIRKKFDQPKPFEGLTAATICQKINDALDFAKATIDNEIIKVKAVAQFPNGDLTPSSSTPVPQALKSTIKSMLSSFASKTKSSQKRSIRSAGYSTPKERVKLPAPS
ncbi:uncharacterized protein PGTG_22707 [Puccinia graminis f. sp. tritici CRL 75-36-700-3]|uniref:Uncharacterized protein n=1 Tax=Puccinia graminis f. sp. tritici (strain CRL 75-36-700-3 / race SCCL) TaxID=418459 RepID=H6QVD1_PUCGT|nr:uncharacterized protein PGTG_22707 [Puccinia graminis f. sp. tritici CRL 75-36-700-3]EHS62860.1 hypothetical protein PGTG_22707 [Puccinia graminis f. sp. tritici CRL 75-36-700-3]